MTLNSYHMEVTAAQVINLYTPFLTWQAAFLWPTLKGCPVCTSEDYTNVVDECVNGKASVLGKKVSMCNGPDTIDQGQQDCSRRYTVIG